LKIPDHLISRLDIFLLLLDRLIPSHDLFVLPLDRYVTLLHMRELL
jgi:hypothetical protein